MKFDVDLPAPSVRAQVAVPDQEAGSLVAPYSRSLSRTVIRTILDAEGKGKALVGRTVTVGG